MSSPFTSWVTSAVSIVTTMSPKLTFTPYGWLVCVWVLIVSFQVPVLIPRITHISPRLLISVWISYFGPKSNSGDLDLSSCPTLSFPWFAYMHSYVRRNILPSYVDVHGGRVPWQFHRQHGHGTPRTEGCTSIQWIVSGGGFGPNGHCTVH